MVCMEFNMITFIGELDSPSAPFPRWFRKFRAILYRVVGSFHFLVLISSVWGEFSERQLIRCLVKQNRSLGPFRFWAPSATVLLPPFGLRGQDPVTRVRRSNTWAVIIPDLVVGDFPLAGSFFGFISRRQILFLESDRPLPGSAPVQSAVVYGCFFSWSHEKHYYNNIWIT